METLKTARGKTFETDYFNPCPPVGQVNLRILGASVATVAEVFSHPAETVQLYCGNQYISAFTKLIAIVPEGDAVRVVLGKE